MPQVVQTLKSLSSVALLAVSQLWTPLLPICRLRSRQIKGFYRTYYMCRDWSCQVATLI